MSERAQGRATGLQIRGLHVYYGQSHALQGVDLDLGSGLLAVVGRNGMGKTTLCQAIMGLTPSAGGSVRFMGTELRGLTPTRIARLGVGYVPQGRRLWPSLSVDEHLRICERGGAWTRERVYQLFPRLAERRNNGGGQLSGGEQQMLAISRALLGDPRLLIMDEPTEGLAPVIVEQVQSLLLELVEDGDVQVLLIEQNIGVATSVSEQIAIMVNGRVNRMMAANLLANDRGLQQQLLGVGRHGDLDAELEPANDAAEAGGDAPLRARATVKLYIANPTPPTRWSAPVSLRDAEFAARNVAPQPRLAPSAAPPEPVTTPVAGPGRAAVLVVGTFDTKGLELGFIRDQIAATGLAVRTVDVSTSGRPSGADVPPHHVASYHRGGANAVFTRDRGESVRQMSIALEVWMARQHNVAGVISAGGSGGTALVTPAMRTLPVGVPKVMISTVASGDVSSYVGPADIAMLYSVTDVQGLNAISRQVLANGAHAVAGMVAGRIAEAASPAAPTGESLPAIGLTMFGLTTPCVQAVTAALEPDYECLVFHATGIGGRSMEKLVDSGFLQGVLDITTTEVCDLLMGGIFPATEDRFGAIIRAGMPYVGSTGALDMVNFAAPDTVPERYAGRTFYEHNPEVTLMRTTPDENERMGRWIAERLNQMTGPVKFLIPEGGFSGLDARGQPFFDEEADAALINALEHDVRETGQRQLIKVPHHINDPAFAAAAVEAFRAISARRPARGRRRGF